MKIKSKSIEIKGRLFTVSESGDIWRLAFVDKAGACREKLLMKHSNNNGYLNINFSSEGKCQKIGVHRVLAMCFLDDYSEDLQVDHINGNRSDNRLENLRMVTGQENQRAYTRKKLGSTSRFRGVSRKRKGKKWENWKAKIHSNGVDIYLGMFESEYDAAAAWDEAAIAHGYFPEALNFKKTSL